MNTQILLVIGLFVYNFHLIGLVMGNSPRRQSYRETWHNQKSCIIGRWLTLIAFQVIVMWTTSAITTAGWLLIIVAMLFDVIIMARAWVEYQATHSVK